MCTILFVDKMQNVFGLIMNRFKISRIQRSYRWALLISSPLYETIAVFFWTQAGFMLEFSCLYQSATAENSIARTAIYLLSVYFTAIKIKIIFFFYCSTHGHMPKTIIWNLVIWTKSWASDPEYSGSNHLGLFLIIRKFLTPEDSGTLLIPMLLKTMYHSSY